MKFRLKERSGFRSKGSVVDVTAIRNGLVFCRYANDDKNALLGDSEEIIGEDIFSRKFELVDDISLAPNQLRDKR